MIRQEILDYLKTQRIGVLAVEMLDGSPHAATVHFAHTENPFVFYFETYRDYRKAEPLYGRDLTRASFVVGFDESNMKTLQLDGVVQLLKPDEQMIFDSVYLGKFSEKKKKAEDPKFVFFKFTPTWWRFTDWKAPAGEVDSDVGVEYENDIGREPNPAWPDSLKSIFHPFFFGLAVERDNFDIGFWLHTNDINDATEDLEIATEDDRLVLRI